MLTVRLRLWGMLAGWALKGRKAPPAAVSRLAMRCWPSDLDINMHMNNSRYLALMDVGRWHFLLATGLIKPALANKWAPVAVRVEIDFKKSIQPGARFVLETQQEKVGSRSATLLQRFWVGDVLAAEARVVVLFLHQGKPVELSRVIESLPHLRELVATG